MSHQDPYSDISTFEAKYGDLNGSKIDTDVSNNDIPICEELGSLSFSEDGTQQLENTSSTSGTAPDSFFDRRIEDALQLGETLATDLVNAVKSMPSEAVQSDLLDNALRLSSRPLPATRIIGVVGESGHGKSSLVNSLLGIKDLAMTGGSGSAVTSFVVEYRLKEDNQELPYLFSCTKLTGTELHEEMEQLLEDLHFGQPEQLQQLKDGELLISEERYEKLVHKARTAKTVFETTFTTLPDFSLTRLEYKNVAEKEDCLRTIIGWTEQLSWPCSVGATTWTEAAETPHRLNELVQSLCDQGLWPLLKHVSVHLESPILTTGIVLADIPGYHDVNLARERAAKQYERLCSDLIVVADIKRAVTNPIIGNVIQGFRITSQEIGLSCSKNIVVVCTHAGTVADNDKAAGQLVDPVAIARAKTALDAVRKSNAAYLTVKAAEHEYNMLLMTARNKGVVLGLQKRYHSSFSPSSLPVYCVDNHMYFDEEFPLCRQASGIADLRRHITDLAKERLLEEALHYLTMSIPGLLSRYELCVGVMRSMLHPANHLVTEIQALPLPKVDLLSDCILAVEEWKTAVTDAVQLQINLPLKSSEQATVYAALATVNSWRAMHHSSIWAWFRRHGCNSTEACPYKNWNAELVASFAIKQPLHNFNLQCIAQLGRVKENIGSVFTAFNQKLVDVQLQERQPNALLTAMNVYIETVKFIGWRVMEDFCRELEDIEHDGSTGEATSYMVDFMLPAYKEGAEDSGRGVTNRRMALLNSHVGRPLFAKAHRKRLQRDIQALLDRTEASIQSQMDPIIESIDRDMELVQRKSTRQRRTSSSTAASNIDPAVLATSEDVLKRAAAVVRRIETLVKAAGRAPAQNGLNGHVREEKRGNSAT